MIGRTISHYRILEKLGEGGMGIVYKALDTHLDRLVAIKVLPSERVADAERRRRFVQEAKTASALNHPNIITIYDIATENGADFIAMEYVSGKALNQLILRKGLPLGEALKYVVQIADALAAAHAAGIIHRDLKPGNVMVAGAPERAGLVKVLDFGLAKLTDKVGASEREFTETIKQDETPVTGEGTIVGTVSYMSPEQAEGKKLDARSDIFSFGALLYEMVTGRRAFQGDSKLSTLSAILRDEPKPAGEIAEGLPHELERIIARCLRKSPERRFQTMADLKVALEELKEESDSGMLGRAAVPARHGSRRMVWAAGLIAAAVLVLPVTFWFVQSGRKVPEAPLVSVPLTTYPGFQTSPSFSPDGTEVAFAWNGEKRNNLDIYRKVVGTSGSPLRLTTDPAPDFDPVWSPDGRFIAFLRGLSREKAAVLLIPALGGPERKLAEIFISDFIGSFLDWSPDSNWLVMGSRDSLAGPLALVLMSVETGEKRKLTSPPAPLLGDAEPAFSPDGRTMAFTRSLDGGLSGLYLLALTGELKPAGEPRRIRSENRSTAGLCWTADGREIIFSAGSFGQESLWRVAASGSNEPRPLSSLGGNLYHPTLSRRGRHLAYVHRFFHRSIWRISAQGGPRGGLLKGAKPFTDASLVVSSSRDDSAPRFSPDGQRIAFMSSRSGNPEIWVCDRDGSNAVQLTFFRGPEVTTPRWSPDSSKVAFDSNAAGEFDIYVVGVNGGKPQRMTTHPANDGNPSWSRDGQWIYFDSARPGEQQVFKIPASGGEAIQVTRDGGFAPIESSDGKFIYYMKALSDSSLWRTTTEGGEATKIVDGVSSYQNVAIVDGGAYFVPERQGPGGWPILFLNFATNEIQPVANFEKSLRWGSEGGLAVSPDGKWILCTQTEQNAGELMLVENFH